MLLLSLWRVRSDKGSGDASVTEVRAVCPLSCCDTVSVMVASPLFLLSAPGAFTFGATSCIRLAIAVAFGRVCCRDSSLSLFPPVALALAVASGGGDTNCWYSCDVVWWPKKQFTNCTGPLPRTETCAAKAMSTKLMASSAMISRGSARMTLSGRVEEEVCERREEALLAHRGVDRA